MLDAAPRSNNRPLVFAAIMLSMFMVALEGTIVATAMPRIVGELGGFTYYSWAFSGYLLAQCVTALIYGKLADIYGRKPIMLIGIAIFLVGSILAGVAPTMLWLIIFRFVQGVGAGAIQPLTITIVGDLYEPRDMPRAQAILSTVWSGSAVLGPLAGGLIIDHLSWAWIFWINVPICVLAMILYGMFLHETVAPRAVKIDYRGAALFAISIISLLVLLSEIDQNPGFLAALGAVFVISGLLFVREARRAPAPIVSIQLWRRPLIAWGSTASFCVGMTLIGLTVALPIYVQGVLGRSPVIAGATLTMLILGWTLAMMLSVKLFRRYGIGIVMRLGSLTLPVGALFLQVLSPTTSPILPIIGALIMGIGMGLISNASTLLVQSTIEWSLRGSATAAIIFSRALGNALGAALLGTVLNLGVAHFGSGALAAQLHAVLNQPTGLADLTRDPAVQAIFDAALHWCFWVVQAIALLTCVASFMLPVPREAGRAAR